MNPKTRDYIRAIGGETVKSEITKDAEVLAHKGKKQRLPKPGNEKIPRKTVENLVWSLCRTLRLIKSRGWRMEIAGSYRRGHEYVGDIDLVYSNQISDVLYRLPMNREIASWRDEIPYGSDIVECTSEQFPFALLYLTGNAEFNIACRSRAKKLGMKLNQWGLFDAKGGLVLEGIPNEHDILSALKMRYFSPMERDFRFSLGWE